MNLVSLILLWYNYYQNPHGGYNFNLLPSFTVIKQIAKRHERDHSG